MAWILPSVTSPPLASSGLRLRTSWVVLPMVSRDLSLGFVFSPSQPMARIEGQGEGKGER